MNKRTLGQSKEQEAAAYLKQQGMTILACNYRNRSGEIDIIGRHEAYLVFVEVKYRKDEQKGHALEAVDIRKQRQICKVANYYRMTHGIGEFTPIRYDVVGIQGDKITWITNAFYHV